MRNPLFALPLALLLLASSGAIERACALTIPGGTLVLLNLEERLSSTGNRTGDPVRFTVAESVTVDGVVVIRRGAAARGTVSLARGSRSWGRAGKCEIRYLHVTDDRGNQVPITFGARAKEGNNRGGNAAGASAGGLVLLGPVGLIGGNFVKGKNVEIPANTRTWVEVSADTRF